MEVHPYKDYRFAYIKYIHYFLKYILSISNLDSNYFLFFHHQRHHQYIQLYEDYIKVILFQTYLVINENNKKKYK